MSKIICNIDHLEKKKWADFVSRHPGGSIFQTPQMYDVFNEAKGYDPFVIAIQRDTDINGIFSGVILKEFSGVFGGLTARSIIWGGPLLEHDDGETLKNILFAYDDLYGKKVVYSQIRNLINLSWSKPFFIDAGYEFEEHLNYLVDLKKSEGELWKLVHGKRRNEIRRATKENTVFSIHDDENSLISGYEILKEVYSFAKLPFPDISLFRSILLKSTENFGLKIFAAKNQGEMIGVMFALIYKNRIYDWYAGAYRKYHNKYPNDIIPWEVIKWGKANGFEIFDFGGAGKPNIPYGVRDYKMKFGGELVNYGRFQKIHRPKMMKMATTGFKLWCLTKGLR